VWSSIEALYDFTYRSDHKTVFKRPRRVVRAAWPTEHVWWQADGTPPSVERRWPVSSA
jgi:hypothetical protein